MKTVTYRTGVFLTEETIITHFIEDETYHKSGDKKIVPSYFSRPEIVRKNSKTKKNNELHSSGC